VTPSPAVYPASFVLPACSTAEHFLRINHSAATVLGPVVFGIPLSTTHHQPGVGLDRRFLAMSIGDWSSAETVREGGGRCSRRR
jgi:hypothetical protein